jgi:sensor domain CHASE-containing protein
MISKNIKALCLSVSVLIIAATFFIGSYAIVKKVDSYLLQIQLDATAQNIKIIEGIFGREMESLSILVSDWTLWDELYEYAGDPNSQTSLEFAKANFEDLTFEQIKINILIITNQKNEVIFSKQIYDRNPEEKAVPDAVFKEIDLMWPDGQSKDTDTIEKTVVDLGDKKLLLTSRQITKADTTGEPTGKLIFGRYVESGFISELDNVPGFYFNVTPYLPNDPKSLYANIREGDPFSMRIENKRKIVGVALIKDLATRGPLVLEVESIPIIYAKTIDIIMFMTFVFSVCFVVTIMIAAVALKIIYPKPQKSESTGLDLE